MLPAGQVVELWRTLSRARQTLDGELQRVTDLILLTKSHVNRRTTPGEQRSLQAYDGTAPQAAHLLATTLGSSMTPQDQRWFGLRLLGEEETEPVREWLEASVETMLERLAGSGFYEQIDELYLDLVGYGTGALYVGETERGLQVETWPIRSYVMRESADGRVSTVVRRFEPQLAQLVERFESHPGFRGWPERISRELGKGDVSRLTRRETVLHLIAPNPDAKANPVKPEHRPFVSQYVLEKDKHTLAVSGFMELPVMVARWRKNADDEGWGRGPGLQALPDIQLLNEALRILHKAAIRDLDPPLVADDNSVVGQLAIRPRGVTYLRPGARLEYLVSGTRPDLALLDMQGLRQSIRNAFFVDQLQLPPPGSQTMTATEVQVRLELMQRLLGPTLGRLERELLDPIIRRVFGLLLRRGELGDPPSELQGKQLVVEYVSPLARAQKQSDVVAIERLYQAAGGIAQLVGPDALDRLDPDRTVSELAELLGAPATILRDDKQVQALRQQRAAVQQQQAALAQQAAEAQVAKDGAQALQALG